jgi:peptide subunit release factor 1 (eRF1)
MLKKEDSTVINIKDKRHSKEVITTLECIRTKLKIYKCTPSNGLAIFSGYCI